MKETAGMLDEDCECCSPFLYQSQPTTPTKSPTWLDGDPSDLLDDLDEAVAEDTLKILDAGLVLHPMHNTAHLVQFSTKMHEVGVETAFIGFPQLVSGSLEARATSEEKPGIGVSPALSGNPADLCTQCSPQLPSMGVELLR